VAGAGGCRAPGGAVQVEPMKPMLKGPETNLLTVKSDEPLSTLAFKFNLCRYTLEAKAASLGTFPLVKVWRCRLTLSNPR